MAFAPRGVPLAVGGGGADVGAHGRAERKEQRQKRQPRVIVRAPQVVVEDHISEVAQAAVMQVHEQKREIVEHIANGDFVVEFDGIEDRRTPVNKANVTQMQIAVKMADKTGAATPVEEIGAPVERGFRSDGYFGDFVHVKHGARVSVEPRGIDLKHAPHGLRAANVAALLRRPMKAHDCGSQIVHHGGGQFATPSHAIEQRVLVEPVHFDKPIDRFATPAERQSPRAFPAVTATTLT